MSTVDAVVIDAEGLAFNARLESTTDDLGGGVGESQILLHLEDGTQFLVPAELLVPRADGRYDLRLNLREYAAQTELEAESVSTAEPGETLEPTAGFEVGRETEDKALEGDTVVPLAEETLKVSKRSVMRGRVQLHKYVTERTETADVTLVREQLEVEHVKVGRPVDEAAPVRYEGDTVVIPLYEEVLVVTKQLRLVEEVRVKTQRSERQEPQQVILRREEVEVERRDAEADE